jgi:ribosomal protein L37AE/L43A
MPDESPFKNAYDPIASHAVVQKCPKCKAADFDAFTNQYGVHRTCRKCKNEWSGGGAGLTTDSFMPPSEQQIASEEDIPDPASQDPGRNIGGDR